MRKGRTDNKKSSPRYVYTGHEEFPENNIELTSKELEILFKQPPQLMKLYIFLNLYRDFDTNITGELVHIDDISFKLWLGYPSKTGRKAWKPSTTHVVRGLKQLEFLGLIERRGNNVFYLPLAHIKNHNQKISHQGVTKVSPNFEEGVTNSNSNETSINTEENAKTKNDVSPNFEEGVTEAEQRLYTIPYNNLTKLNYTHARARETDFLSAEENKFLNLFTDLRLRVKPAGDLKAITAAKALVGAGVSIDVAREVIKIKLAGYKSDNTPHPSYFTQAIIDYKRELDSIDAKKEVTHERQRQRADTTSSRRHRYSNILRQVAEVEDDNENG